MPAGPCSFPGIALVLGEAVPRGVGPIRVRELLDLAKRPGGPGNVSHVVAEVLTREPVDGGDPQA
nr:hypothetical protein GCM10010200_043220 [Actinomadura rugatobispora]